MTKKQIEKKIKQILTKDKNFIDATIKVKYVNKSETKKATGKFYF